MGRAAVARREVSPLSPVVIDGLIYGAEVPRLYTPPLQVLTPETSLGFECIEFAENILGLDLMPWQKWFLIHSLELKDEDLYRFKQVLLLVARQNGKTTVVKALILWKMFVDDARLILGGAQSLSDAEDTWESVVDLALSLPLLEKRLARPHRSIGKRRLTSLAEPDGSRKSCVYRLVTLKKDAGRGKAADFLFLDELREHRSWDGWGALEPTTRIPPRSQIFAASNAGDSQSVVLRAKRAAALEAIRTGKSRDSVLGLFEYSATDDCALDDEVEIAQANPAYRWLMSPDSIVAARENPESVYRTETLCQEQLTLQSGVIPPSLWLGCFDKSSRIADDSPVYCAVDVSWNRSHAAVAVAGKRDDGVIHVEIVAYRASTDWLIPWLKRRQEVEQSDWFTGFVACQARGAPVSSMIEPFQQSGLEVVEWSGSDLGRSFGLFFDAIREKKIRHLGQPILNGAVDVAREKRLNDASFIDRRNTAADVCPIIAVQAAYWYATRAVRAPRKSIYEIEGVSAMFTSQGEGGIA